MIQLLFGEKDCRRRYDILVGSNGADYFDCGEGTDYFDCGEGTDVVIDFNIIVNDENADNCEVIMGSKVIMIR